MFQWIFEHMTKELTVLPPSTMKFKVFASPVSKYPVWIGGSILSFSVSLTAAAKREFCSESQRGAELHWF